MSKVPNSSLRKNPFHSYRDPETGQWVTVVPKSAPIEKLVPSMAVRRLHLIDPEDFAQLQHSATA